jgi:hypothetical protein
MGRCKQAEHCGNPAWCKTTGKCLKVQPAGATHADELERLKNEQTLMSVVAEHNERALLVEIRRLTAEREAWLNLNAVVKSLTATPKDG